MKGALESGVFDTPLRIGSETTSSASRASSGRIPYCLERFAFRCAPFLYTRAPLPGTGAEPEGPTSRGRGTVRNRRDAKAGRIGFSISSRRDTRYTSTMESIGRRPTLTRRRPWRSGTVAPSGPVRPAAGSGRRAVPSDSGLVVASAPACAFGFRRSYSHGALPAQYS